MQKLRAFPDWNFRCRKNLRFLKNGTAHAFQLRTFFGGNRMNAKAGAKLFVVLYFVLLVPMVLMTGGIGIAAFAAIPIIGSAEAMVLSMLYFTIFFGHHEDHEELAVSSSPAATHEAVAHRMAHG